MPTKLSVNHVNNIGINPDKSNPLKVDCGINSRLVNFEKIIKMWKKSL